MKKPEIKQEVAIYFTSKSVKHISFYATSNATEDFRNFGQMTQFPGNENTELYELFVDARYDFDEVVNYIKSYGDE